MKKNAILENIKIEKLVFWWKGFARLDDGRVCFITGWAIPWSRVNLKVIKKKRDFIEAQITEVIEKSPIETWSYEVIPGTPWINIEYSEQLKIKDAQVEEALFHCKKYQDNIPHFPIIPMDNTFWYRNKIEFSFWKYISHRENIFQDFNIWFHKRWDFSRVLDFENCILIDELQNDIYKDIRKYTQESWLPVYDQKTWTWFWRHLMIRGMHFSEEILLVFSINPNYFEDTEQKTIEIEKLKKYLTELLVIKYPKITSIYISHNTNKADTLIWELELVYGSETISETILWYSFDIGPKSFFQTNSVWAEKLYSHVREFAINPEQNEWNMWNNTKLWTILDLYAGTWTIGMIFSDIADEVISVELVEEASRNWEKNAQKNQIQNMRFVNAKVEDFLDEYMTEQDTDNTYKNLLIIDPPRAGMHPKALPNILKFWTQQIIYVSCNPATLGRDLEYILANSEYRIEKVQAVDMFPHTHHIEIVVSLTRKSSD